MATRFVFRPFDAEFKTSTFPDLAQTSDASGARPYLGFDASADEAAYFTAVAPANWTNTAVTAVVTYAMASATSGAVVFDVAVEAISDGDTVDTDAAESLDTANVSSAATVPGTAGYIDQVSITLATHDSSAAGDLLRFRVRRLGSSGSDTATGDANVYAVEIRDAL